MGVNTDLRSYSEMYSKTPTGKASKGSVQVIASHGRLQLRFRVSGKRHYISLGLPDTPKNRELGETKARKIELDILSGQFDSTLQKYKSEPLLNLTEPKQSDRNEQESPEHIQCSELNGSSEFKLEDSANAAFRSESLLSPEEVGRRQERREIIECFLYNKFGLFDEVLSQSVDVLVQLPPRESTKLLVTLSKSELIQHVKKLEL